MKTRASLKWAKSMLEVLMKLNPDLPGLKEKLDQLESKMFDSQEMEFVFDTSKQWAPIGAAAVRGKSVRVEVAGSTNSNTPAV